MIIIDYHMENLMSYWYRVYDDGWVTGNNTHVDYYSGETPNVILKYREHTSWFDTRAKRLVWIIIIKIMDALDGL